MAKKLAKSKSAGVKASPKRKSAKKTASAKKPAKTAKKPSRRFAAAVSDLDQEDPDRWIESASSYAKHKARAGERQKQLSREGRDIAADMPKLTAALLKQRKRLSTSLRKFCEEVLTERFHLGWSADHLKAIEKMERAILTGSNFAIAMPRGSGKTTLVIAACLWAILYGHKRYFALIGCDRDAATKLLDGIKVELETNDRLLELFPEAVYPIRRLEGIANRCRGQLYDGQRTYIRWTAKHIQFASIPKRGENTGSASGAIIETAGIRGKIRGMQQALPTGEIARPDCFVVDDPQTDTSADSRKQVKSRLNVITGTCPGLAGPGKKISGFVTCTVICPDDVADQILNPQKFPDYQGERFQLVYAWPKSVDRWEEYSTIYRESMAMGEGFAACNRFVRKHWDELHQGARVAWEIRHRDDEVSPLQHAYNLLLRLGDTFWSEYQNQPVTEEDDEDLLPVDDIQVRTNGFARGVVPPAANMLSSYIDVQGECLFYVVTAVNRETYSSWVLDYGAFPKQTAIYFTKRTLGRKLSREFPGANREGRIRAGILQLIDDLCSRDWKMPDRSTSLRISQLGIDAAWGPATRVIQAAVLESKHRAIVLPTFGRPLEAKDLPMEFWKPKAGEQLGIGYAIRPRKGGGNYGLLDANYWKSFVHSRLATAVGDKGSLSLFDPELVTTHRMIAEHCRSEKREESTKGSRTTHVWTLPASKPDNDLFDCLAGSLAMAGIKGARLGDLTVKRTTRRKTRRPTTLKT